MNPHSPHRVATPWYTSKPFLGIVCFALGATIGGLAPRPQPEQKPATVITEPAKATATATVTVTATATPTPTPTPRLTAVASATAATPQPLAKKPAAQLPNPPAPPGGNDPAPAVTKGGGDVYYASCAQAKAAGAAPLRRGQPGYRPGLDRDNDGVACEN